MTKRVDEMTRAELMDFRAELEAERRRFQDELAAEEAMVRRAEAGEHPDATRRFWVIFWTDGGASLKSGPSLEWAFRVAEDVNAGPHWRLDMGVSVVEEVEIESARALVTHNPGTRKIRRGRRWDVGTRQPRPLGKWGRPFIPTRLNMFNQPVPVYDGETRYEHADAEWFDIGALFAVRLVETDDFPPYLDPEEEDRITREVDAGIEPPMLTDAEFAEWARAERARRMEQVA